MPKIEVKIEKRGAAEIAQLVHLLDRRTMRDVMLIPAEALALSRELVRVFARPASSELGEFAFCLREVSDSIYRGYPLADLVGLIGVVHTEAYRFCEKF